MAPTSLWLYRVALRTALPVVLPTLWLSDRVIGKRRPPLSDRLARRPAILETGGVWIHAVSVGEVEVARRLLDELADRRPQLPVLVTATTATGLELARRTVAESATVAPSPIDLIGPLGRTLDAARPRLVVLVETELWPELLHQAGRRGVPVAVVNGRLSDRSWCRYRRVRWLLGSLLRPLALVLVRGPGDLTRFIGLGVSGDRIQVAGNIKYDLEPDGTPLAWERTVRDLAGARPILIAGSTLEGEEALLLDALDSVRVAGHRWFLVIAPRHPERFEDVANLLRDRGLTVARRSRLAEIPRPADAFLIDSIGELARAYRMAEVAFVGGSLIAGGGHNPLEPAVWGVPVVSGPWVSNFREIYHELAEAGGASIVQDGEQLARALELWLDDPQRARSAGAAGRAVVERNRGATARTVAALLRLIDDSP